MIILQKQNFRHLSNSRKFTWNSFVLFTAFTYEWTRQLCSFYLNLRVRAFPSVILVVRACLFLICCAPPEVVAIRAKTCTTHNDPRWRSQHFFSPDFCPSKIPNFNEFFDFFPKKKFRKKFQIFFLIFFIKNFLAIFRGFLGILGLILNDLIY